MCGRTSLFVPQSVLEARFDAEAAEPIIPRYNIGPKDDLAVIPNEDPDTIEQFRWGLVPHWVDDPDDFPELINARAETVAEKNSFRDAFNKRRCLVLADGFYEWHGERGHKQPYRITRADEEPFAFAGLWETWERNGDFLETTTIITTDANDLVEGIHDRMPVILESENESTWLEEDDPDELHALLDPFDSGAMEASPVSTKVNDPGYDHPDVVDSIDIGEQSGLSEFS